MHAEDIRRTMTTSLLIARVLLAGIIAVAGITKLADRSGSRQAIIGFGLPSSRGGYWSYALG
jgi:uncharacterized membrane protein YphA (DoxX/SURF4 family)